MTDLVKDIANLSVEKRELLLQRLRQKKENASQTKIASQSRDSNIFPLSFAQQRLWFLEQFEPGNPFYNQPAAVRLTGALNLAVLEQSFNEIIRRHEVLRTTFITAEGQPLQLITPTLALKLPVIDLQKLPNADREKEVLRVATKEAQVPFNLVKGPLLRCTLLRLDKAEYVLLFTMHHIISDGWSRGILIREMAVLYEAFSNGQLSPLAELPIQYADFAAWQRQWLQKEVLQSQISYWKKHLEGAPSVLELPTDHPRPAVQTFRGATYSFELSVELSQALKKLSQQQGTTLFMTLLAAFQTLLWRYTGQEDIVVGSPIANRNRAEIERLIGFFVNTVVLRTNLASNPTFGELLTRVREVALGAYAHQDLPFEKLVDELQPQRDLSHTPLFQVMFALQNAPMSALELSGLSLSLLASESGSTKFDLTLLMTETAQGLVGTLEYNTDLFESSTISRMAEHLQTLLSGIVDNPQQRLSELPLLTQAEKALLVQWNDTSVEYPQRQCIHQLFEAQVERTPDAVAVVFEDEQLTYCELNTRANQLAHYLRSLGVEPEVLVGICVERSLSMIIGLLSILKAGGAYVPLDHTYPKERLAFALQDAQIPVLLTQQRLIENLPESQTRVVCLDTDWGSIAKECQQNLISECTSDNLAYIIYTSGSTGQPKGVLVNHGNVVRLLAATQSWYHFNQQDVFSLFHSIAFDFSVWELWGALLYGGQLVVVPYWLSRSPEDFYKLLLTQQVTVLNQTPSAFRQLIQAEELLGGANQLSLRLVIFGGEALELQSLKPWFQRHGDQFPQLVNMYGITETTVHVTYRPITMVDLEVACGSVIGRPIPDLQVYLLDQYGQPVPIGIHGEMYIGGAGVARGYLNRPELTGEKFIPNSFSDKPNARFYKSGDQARYLPNGDIEYLGRIDHQVKVRGFRIELGEIENALAKHQAVRETVVLARETQPGNKQLVAYVVPHNEQTPATSDLRNFLIQQLPEYMVPGAFVMLEALPLTHNGKIDHRVLPAPDNLRPELEEVFVTPRTSEEKILAEIWAKVLGLEEVGINDNFFALGGDSIRSIRVQSLAKQKGLSFSIQQIFQHQTIQQLIQNLTTAETDNRVIKPVQPFELICKEDHLKLPEDVEDAYPLSKLQMGMLFHSEYNSESATYHNVSSYYLQASFKEQHFQTALEQLAARHPILRTSFDLSSFQEPLQLVHKVVHIPLQVEDICHFSPAEQEELLTTWFEAEKHLSFDWTKAPLLRFCIHRRSKETFQFSLTEHHVLLDGWSVASMITELFGHYFSLFGEKVHPIEPPPATNFKDFIALEREAIISDACQHYWTEKLSDSTTTVLSRWSSEYYKDSVQQVSTYEVPISLEVSDGLNQLARSLGVPIKSVLLAAHMRVLSLLSGKSDVITGLVSNGRPEETDGDRILGLFLNTLPYRLQLLGNTWIDLVLKTFESEQELIPFRRYPLAELQRVTGRESLFETAFNYVNFHVYGNLSNVGIKVLDAKSFAITNITFFANFGQSPFSSEVSLNLEYDTTVLCEQQIRAIGDYYLRCLTAMASEPHAYYKYQVLLSAQEQNQLLVEWNDTQTKYPIDQCIHQLFEAQVESTPNAVAVVFEDEQLTYCELNARTNQLAHYLQKLGVGPEVLVGICVERSLNMIIGLLGILKAGGAYVPLDPTYPKERLAFMLKDACVSMLLTQQKLLESLPVQDARVVCLDKDWQVISRQSEANLVNTATSQNLAYVVYTSGSTGKSKGVAINHCSLINAYQAWENAYRLRSVTSHLQMASFSFDVFSGDLIRALCSGAKLVLCPREWLLEPEKLYKLMRQEKIDSAEFVPAVMRNLVQYLEKTKQDLHFMRLLVVGSDSLYLQEYEEFKHLCGSDTRLINSYGVSEATIDSTYFESEKVNFPVDGLVPIGRPFANTQTYILDSHLQLVPIGVTGELHIGGVGLARGYINREDLTSQKFIPNPFEHSQFPISYSPFNRLYKTGDLARYLPNGNIELLGRIDHQVKIRGFRIELGEIEALLNQHSVVREAVVISMQDVSDYKRLVAYVVPNIKSDVVQGQTSAAEQMSNTQFVPLLRQHLKSKLPNYMVPAAFVMLEGLPLTPNGKVDRKALPAPEVTQLLSESDFIAPSTPIEEMLALIWAEVLSIEKVGIHNNFFTLGGHSLLATRVISKVRQVFQQELPLRRLFEQPTIAGLAKDIEKATKAGLGLEAPKIERISRSQNLPLSFAQQRLWFLAQLEPNSPFYNIPAAVRLEGQLNLEALQQSFNEILRRHEALRTNFQTIEGQPVAIISSVTSLLLPIFNITELPSNQQQAEVRKLADKEAQRPFDLNSDLLLRVKLLRLGEQEHIVLLTMHHIASDGWSTDVLVRELVALYQAFHTGQPSPLAELPIQYVDFAAWQRQWLQGEILKSQISYWKKQLEGAPSVLELPTDHARPAIMTFAGATYSFELSQELSVAINKLSERQGTTLFMTLLVAFQTLLWRYTGQEDIVVGSPIANRNRAEIEGLIGFFINTLVLRTNLAGNPTFEELLTRVREVALGAYAHQDLPFEQLVEELQPQRSLSHTPLFQVMFVLQNAPMSVLELPGLALSPLESDSGGAKFDLTLYMTETAQGLVGSLEYNTGLFEQSTVSRMAGHLQTLLEGIVANSQQRLKELPLLTKPERQTLLVEWNDTSIEYPQQQCIHQLFEDQVKRTPDAVAVVFEDQQLAYCELNARANQLAHYLRSLGVGPEVLVGICVERSLSMIIGLLGILKAGGAYLPLDPTYPQERLAFILEDAQVPVLLTQQRLVEVMPQHKAKIICLDTDWQTIAQQSQENLFREVAINNLAYVIYTSGSTGKPKGVQIPHSALSNFLHAMQQTPGLSAQDTLLAVTTYSFDIAALELFLPITVGARLVLVSREVASDGTRLRAKLTDSNATVMQATPATWQLLLAASWQGNHQLKILCGGEALPGQLANQLLKRCGSLWNMYGPTETTIWSAACLVETNSSVVPISQPIANTQFYILDQYGQLVPIGVPGELHIGGDGLARGYLNRPELSAEKFIPNPFSNKSAARLYKTGDLARYLRNGEIEYLGRIDHQVKVRGFRTELGEIEAHLSQHPKVQETVVVVRSDEASSQRIVAYVVPQKEQTLTITELRDFLESKLPNYMVPAAFVMLEALPLTPNGKVDRKALVGPDTARPELETVYQPPQTEVEKTIANLWQEVLHVEDVGIHDNFFELGGHSLLLVQTHSKLQNIFQRDFPLVEMFQYPTISRLAIYLGQESSEQQSFTQHSHRPESRTTSVQRRKQARIEHRSAQKDVSSQ